MEEAVAAPGVTRAALETLVRRRLVRIEERFGASVWSSRTTCWRRS
jgi:hypothetical protein